MEQHVLDQLWWWNGRAVKLGMPTLGIACSADSFEEIIEVDQWTWHRPTGTRRWLRVRPFLGNLRT